MSITDIHVEFYPNAANAKVYIKSIQYSKYLDLISSCYCFCWIAYAVYTGIYSHSICL